MTEHDLKAANRLARLLSRWEAAELGGAGRLELDTLREALHTAAHLRGGVESILDDLVSAASREQMTVRDIAAAMGVSASTVQTRLTRIRAGRPPGQSQRKTTQGEGR